MAPLIAAGYRNQSAFAFHIARPRRHPDRQAFRQSTGV